MAEEDEELRRRRQRRAELRKKRQRQQLMLGILAAAVVFLLCGILIFAMTRPAAENPTATTVGTATTASKEAMESTGSTDATGTTDATEPTTVMHFAAVGDLNLSERLLASGGENGDFSRVFLDVMPELASADLTTVNLEGMACGEPYGGVRASVPEDLLTALKNAGVDMVQSANSYSLTNGLSGLATSLQTIRDVGLEPLGAYANTEEVEKYEGFSLFEVNGIRVAVFAMTKGMNGLTLPSGNSMCVNLLYEDYATTYQTIYADRINYILDNVAMEDPDVVIALLHWGSEYNDSQSKSQKRIEKMLLSGGVDVIIGTHPHNVQPVVTTENGQLVAYSLGDFISAGTHAGTEYSILLDVEITKNNETGETTVTGWDYVPLYTVEEEDGTLRVLRLQTAISAYRKGEAGSVTEAVYEKMLAAMEAIKKRILPPETKS